MILLDIQGYIVSLTSNSEEIDSRLRMDFEYFLTDKKSNSAYLKITANLQHEIPASIIPKNLTPVFQRNNSITYEKNGIRYNDYYGSVVSLFDASKGEASVFGNSIDKLYEVVYLLILSRSGKFLDLKGVHKIHAFSIVKNRKGVVCMQPMRGGKSTLFTELLLNFDIEVGSDDTPLINQHGRLLPFPLRVSLDKLPPTMSLTEDDFYLMKREFYKDKFSISLKSFKKNIAPECSEFIFVEAHRSTYDSPLIVKMPRLKLFKRLFHHMVIGFGLPIIFEYFWESGRADFFRKTKIFMSRLNLALKLSISKRGYELFLCNDSKKNADAIMALLK